MENQAPIVSLAQVEFEEAARRWQDRAREAAEQAELYTGLAAGLKSVYDNLVK